MATFDHKEIVDEIIRTQGEPELGDLARPVKVVEYQNRGGKTTWGVVHRGLRGEVIEDEYRYERETEFIRDPKVIWVHPSIEASSTAEWN